MTFSLACLNFCCESPKPLFEQKDLYFIVFTQTMVFDVLNDGNLNTIEATETPKKVNHIKIVVSFFSYWVEVPQSISLPCHLNNTRNILITWFFFLYIPWSDHSLQKAFKIWSLHFKRYNLVTLFIRSQLLNLYIINNQTKQIREMLLAARVR